MAENRLCDSIIAVNLDCLLPHALYVVLLMLHQKIRTIRSALYAWMHDQRNVMYAGQNDNTYMLWWLNRFGHVFLWPSLSYQA